MIGNVVQLSVCVVTPTMVGATNRVTFDLLIVGHDRGARAFRQVRAHVNTVRIEQYDPATGSAIKRHVLAEKTNPDRPIFKLVGFRDHEPTARKNEFAQFEICCFCHFIDSVLCLARASKTLPVKL